MSMAEAGGPGTLIRHETYCLSSTNGCKADAFVALICVLEDVVEGALL